MLGTIAGVTFVLRRGYLANYYPSPGALVEPHARLASEGALSCNGCHALLGLENGCLTCHEEIEAQLATRRGFHPFLLDGKDADCSRCHHEHRGRNAPLVAAASWQGKGPEGFSHPQVPFKLVCKHADLPCRECHEGRRRTEMTLPQFPERERRHTFLGLTQECVTCHPDPHAGGLVRDCESCHDQAAFRPTAGFDHDSRFPLEGGHRRAACSGCHVIPDPAREPLAAAAPFARSRGFRCADCHASPHRVSLGDNCVGCHGESPDSWSEGRRGMTPAIHERTGFPLSPAHAEVACEKCHEQNRPYGERFRDPLTPEYTRTVASCGGCHRDAHGGQFAARGNVCADCHRQDVFRPSALDAAKHEAFFPLLGAHSRTACEGCHREEPGSRVRKFVGVSQRCESCHDDPHGGQFLATGRTCSECHDPRGFAPSAVDQAAHEPIFALAGGHRAVPCESCHRIDPGTGVRRFAGTARECKGCHTSPHGDQFAPELAAGDCTTCHARRTDSFAIESFDHERCVGFALVGAHAKAQCNQCHAERQVRTSESSPAAMVRVFRDTSRECSSCHRDVHLGQFREQGATNCTRCHDPAARWADLRFDHNRQARFPLDGDHARVACNRCHREAPVPGGDVVRVFKPLGASCNDCHAVSHP